MWLRFRPDAETSSGYRRCKRSTVLITSVMALLLYQRFGDQGPAQAGTASPNGIGRTDRRTWLRRQLAEDSAPMATTGLQNTPETWHGKKDRVGTTVQERPFRAA